MRNYHVKIAGPGVRHYGYRVVTRRKPAIESGDDGCPVRQVLAVLGDRWTHVIVFLLGPGEKRFSELQRLIPDISKKMLAQSLDRLESDGLVQRTVTADRPPRVSYGLTGLGRQFREPIAAIYDWGRAHQPQIKDVLRRRARRVPRAEPARVERIA